MSQFAYGDKVTYTGRDGARHKALVVNVTDLGPAPQQYALFVPRIGVLGHSVSADTLRAGWGEARPAKKARPTRKRAEAVAAKLAAHFGTAPDAFTVHEPGFHSGGWTIAAEEGVPYYWTPQASELLNDLNDGLFYEPVNHWCLGIYQG
jgi:hypothetical protein